MADQLLLQRGGVDNLLLQTGTNLLLQAEPATRLYLPQVKLHLVDPACPIDWRHPLNRGLFSNWAGVLNSGWTGGKTIIDMVRGSKTTSNGTLTNGPKWVTGINRLRAVKCSVTDQSYIDCGNRTQNVLVRSFSVVALIKYSAGGSSIIVANGAGGISLRFGSTGIEFLQSHTSSIATGTTIPVENSWYGVAVTVDSAGNYALYVNGKVEASGNTIATFTASTNLCIGSDDVGRAGGSPEYSNCTYSDVRIYNRAISAFEVRALYYQALQGNPDVWRWMYGLSAPISSQPIAVWPVLNKSRAAQCINPASPIEWTNQINRGLISWWLAPPNSGWHGGTKLLDMLGRSLPGHDGTLTNGVSWTSWTNGFKANSFDGVDDYVSLGNGSYVASSTVGTISLWFKLNQLFTSDSAQPLLGYGGTDAVNGSIFGISARVVNATWGANTRFDVVSLNSTSLILGGVGGSTNLQTGVWYHGIVSTNGSTWKLYLNGKLETLNTWVGTNGGYWFANANALTNPSLSLGGTLYQGVRSYGNLSIADVRIYNRRLSDIEAMILYMQSLLGHTETLRWLWLTSVPAANQPFPSSVASLQAYLLRSPWLAHMLTR